MREQPDRRAAAFLVAMTIGAAIGVALGMSRIADRLFDPWLILLLNIPALVVIVLAAAATRLLPHVPNVTAMTALALFGARR